MRVTPQGIYLLLAHLGAKTQFIRHYSEVNKSSAEPWFAMTKGITIANTNLLLTRTAMVPLLRIKSREWYLLISHILA